MNPPLVRCSIPGGRPPHEIVPRLPVELAPRALDAGMPDGWGTGPGPVADNPVHLLGVLPEASFRGGIEALEAAGRWLDAGGAQRHALSRICLGLLAYQLGNAFEARIPPARTALPPPVDLAGYTAVYVFDARRERGEVVGSDPGAVKRTAESVKQALASSHQTTPRWAGDEQSSLERAEFCGAVRAIQDWIRRGDVYQVNLTRRVAYPGLCAAEARVAYATLTASRKAPFSAYCEGADRIVLCNSPERFLRVEGALVETCPIKGTRPRGANQEHDLQLRKELLASEKDRAEHVMIVDLERNDLGRVCRSGGVEVAALAQLRSYPTVHHLVSKVQGRLRSGVGLLEILAASFPGGSITGAPKLRATEIIRDLEPVDRDVYTGAIGYLDALGGCDLALAIRTAVLRGQELFVHTGSGIVADSDPGAEWQETQDKARAFSELRGGVL